MILAAALAGCVGLSCSSASSVSRLCPGSPVELGTQRGSWLGFRVLAPDGTPISGFLWRYRHNLILPGDWSDWEKVEGEDCRRFQACGYAGITDQEEGHWEVEVCPVGYRPLHLVLDLRYSSNGLPLVLRAVAE